jgi:hypothetical protein
MTTKRKRFRKWRNTLSIRQVSYKHHQSVITESNESLVTVLNDWITVHAELLLFRESHRSAYCMNWQCLHCRKPLLIDCHGLLKHSKPIDARQFYCDTCRPAKMTIERMTDPILLRYVNTFYANLKLIINRNSNISDIL